MTAPVRLQLSRRKDFDLQALSRATNGLECVVVSWPSVFGNLTACGYPHNCALRWCDCCPHEGDDFCCVKSYREYVQSGLENRPSVTGMFRYGLDAAAGYPARAALVKRLPELRGKNLACWCAPDKPCHADVLLELANR